MELFPVKDVDLEVEHRRPDPHGWEDLHQRQAPVGHQELDSLEEHGERPHHQGQRRQPTAALTEGQDRALDHFLVAVANGRYQALDLRGHGGTSGRPSRAADLLLFVQLPCAFLDERWCRLGVWRRDGIGLEGHQLDGELGMRTTVAGVDGGCSGRFVTPSDITHRLLPQT